MNTHFYIDPTGKIKALEIVKGRELKVALLKYNKEEEKWEFYTVTDNETGLLTRINNSVDEFPIYGASLNRINKPCDMCPAAINECKGNENRHEYCNAMLVYKQLTEDGEITI